MNPDDDWDRWSKHVLIELTSLRDIRKELAEIRTEIALLKMKAGLWGAAAAMVPVALMIVLQLILR